MKPYMLVQGTTDDLDAFEASVASALEQGYEVSSDLVVNTQGATTQLFQAMIFDDALTFEDDDDDDDFDD